MKKFLILFIFIIVIVGCSKSGDNVKIDGGSRINADVSNNDNNSHLDDLSILKVKDYIVLDKDMEFSESDFNKAMMILDSELENRLKSDQDDYQVNEIKKNEYYFQILKDEEKENNSNKVWIIASCEKPSKWKSNPLMVLDGGPCYFNFKVDLVKEELDSLFINGEA